MTAGGLSDVHARALLALWRAAREGHAAPDVAIGWAALKDAFLTRRADADHHLVVLPGRRLGPLHGREMTGHNILSLAQPADRAGLRAAIEAGLARAVPLVAQLCGLTLNGATRAAELALLPVLAADGAASPLIGILCAAPGGEGAQAAPILRYRVLDCALLAVEPAGRPAPRASAIASALISADGEAAPINRC